MRLSISLTSLMLTIFLCAPVVAHDDHDHDDDHDHESSEKSERVEANPNDSLLLYLKKMGGQIEMIESRIINGKDVIAVPRSAIRSENGKYYVFASEGKDLSKFDQWEITLGKTMDSFYIESKTGLFPGDHVLAIKQTRLSETFVEKSTVINEQPLYSPPVMSQASPLPLKDKRQRGNQQLQGSPYYYSNPIWATSPIQSHRSSLPAKTHRIRNPKPNTRV